MHFAAKEGSKEYIRATEFKGLEFNGNLLTNG